MNTPPVANATLPRAIAKRYRTAQSKFTDPLVLSWLARISTGSIGKWSILTIALVMVGGLLSLPILLSRSQQSVISGRVVSAQTKTPISGVMVAVDSAMSDDTSHGSYVRTDNDGKFVAEIQGDNVWIKAWKPGYRMSGLDSNDAATLSRQALTIEIHELQHSNLATARSDTYTIKSGTGYSLRRGEVVDTDSPDADIIISLNPDDKTSVSIESRGDGGVMFQPETETLNYSAASEAPVAGYQKRVVRRFWPSQGGFLFILARDGKHYAKLALGVDVVTEPGGGAHVTLDLPVSFFSNYQPDGSRSLDSNPTKSSFPFSKFGIDPNSLNR